MNTSYSDCMTMLTSSQVHRTYLDAELSVKVRWENRGYDDLMMSIMIQEKLNLTDEDQRFKIVKTGC